MLVYATESKADELEAAVKRYFPLQSILWLETLINQDLNWPFWGQVNLTFISKTD